jgi:hypothetical protein
MGSRRKKTNERSSAGAVGVSRQARRDPITGQYDKPAPPLANAEPTHEPPARGDTGKHARPDTGKHARLGLVTRQTEDGSFEMVYGALDEEGEPDQEEAPAPIPLWRQRLGLVIAGGLAALLLVVGGAAVALWWFNQDDAPRKVIAKQDDAAAQPAANPKQEPYRYVPPSEVKGRVNLHEEEGDHAAEGPAAAGGGEELNANPPGIATPRTNPAFGVQAPLRGIPSGAALAPRLPQINPELKINPNGANPEQGKLDNPILPNKGQELEEGEEVPEGEEPEEGAAEAPAEGEEPAEEGAAQEPEDGAAPEGEEPAPNEDNPIE